MDVIFFFRSSLDPIMKLIDIWNGGKFDSKDEKY
jgi:hypothetical protein